MRRFRKSTIKEVAAQAGVSTTTVSLFVSGRETVCSPETAERIRQAVTNLNYTPNSLTRGLRQRASTTIGVCLANPLDPDVEYGTTFFEQLWRGVMYQADIEDYSLLHYPAAVRDGESCDAFLDGRVDGMLLHDHENERAALLGAAGMPTVLLTRSLNLPEGCGASANDEEQTVDLALSHLWALGHRRIAFVVGPVGDRAVGFTEKITPTAVWHDDVAAQRLDCYVAWMQEHEAEDPGLIAYTQAWSAPQAAEILARWQGIEWPPTAVFCSNDVQACDLIAAARQRGVRVPEDLSVIGVDNSAMAREVEPALTSIDIRVEEIGREAMCALLRLMRGSPLNKCRVALPISRLVVRRSTAQAR